MRILWWVLQKSGLDIDDKKAFEIESEAHTKPLLMAQSLFEAKAITISQLPLALNSGAFL
ncbi:hypothetical protein [Helicobacter pylori]|uniref:hypothetical protein n=1 Tax=Helicobacter pylori TaxID=210 RepID=UPI000FDF30E7|nr:hypothetical protein [Helicobacter pylori]RVZ54149.1 hypothetical protein EC557_01100 [Helicobacter pylori]RVZ92474.1 hypothetical protein EDC85_00360 [Helicobacter pylori]